MRKTLLAAVLLACLGAGQPQTGSTQTPPAWLPPRFADPGRAGKLAAAFPEIDKAFQEYGRRMPGYVYGVIIDGQLSHIGAGGVRDIASNASVDADTVFRIASMTKSFTAMAILKVRDEGMVSWKDALERRFGHMI